MSVFPDTYTDFTTATVPEETVGYSVLSGPNWEGDLGTIYESGTDAFGSQPVDYGQSWMENYLHGGSGALSESILGGAPITTPLDINNPQTSIYQAANWGGIKTSDISQRSTSLFTGFLDWLKQQSFSVTAGGGSAAMKNGQASFQYGGTGTGGLASGNTKNTFPSRLAQSSFGNPGGGGGLYSQGTSGGISSLLPLLIIGAVIYFAVKK